MPIDQRLRDRAYSSKDQLSGLNREVVPVLKAVRQRVNLVIGVPYKVAPVGGVLKLDWTTNRHYAATLSQDVTSVVFTNPADAGVYALRFDQTGAFTVAGWPDSVRFLRSVVPTVTAIAGSSDQFQFFYDGSDYWAEISQDHR